MSFKRLFLFFTLVAMCVAAASIHEHQSTIKKFEAFQKQELNGNQEAAEAGYRYLAMKFPFTAAGLKSARKMTEGGVSVFALGLKILMAGVKNTSTSEWLLLVSAFLVTTVFMANNALPSIVFFPFILSGAGMFHLFHSMISIDSPAVNAFFEINPVIYTVLTLLIVGGYICNRWVCSRKETYKKVFVHGTLTIAEQLQVKGMYLKRLKGFQSHADRLESKLRTAHGRHFVSELKRLYGVVRKERQHISSKLDSAEGQYREMISLAREVIHRCRQDIIETRILFKSKAFNRKEYRNRLKSIKSTRKKSRRRISEIKAKIEKNNKLHFCNRFQLMRRDVFATFMDEHFIDDQGLFSKIIYKEILSHPQAAKENIMRRKLLYRKSSMIGGKLINLELQRAKLKKKLYEERLASLANEKKILDRELVTLAGKISEEMEASKKQQQELYHMFEALNAERHDLKAFKKIRGFFPAHIKSRMLKIRQDIRFCKSAIPRIRQVEKQYKLSQRMLLE